LAFGIVINSTIDLALLSSDLLQVLQEGAGIPVDPFISDLFRLFRQNAFSSEASIQGIIDLGDIASVFVLVLEVAGIYEDGLYVLFVLEVSLLDDSQPFTDHFFAFVALVELLSWNLKLFESELLGVLCL
jgi:hypothetical protein